MTNPTPWHEKYNIFYYIIKTESMSQTIKDICAWDVDFQFLCIQESRKAAHRCNKGIAPHGAEVWVTRCDPSQLAFPSKH